MNSVLKTGVCVSCGRESGRVYRTCPYCGERVWQPMWRRAGRLALPLLSLASVAALLWVTRSVWASAARMGAWGGFLAAAGVGLALLPCGDEDLVVSSRRELRLWQAQAVAGGVWMAVCAGVAAAAAKAAATDIGVWTLALLLFACVGAAPAFYRLPWRALLGSALVAAGIALG